MAGTRMGERADRMADAYYTLVENMEPELLKRAVVGVCEEQRYRLNECAYELRTLAETGKVTKGDADLLANVAATVEAAEVMLLSGTILSECSLRGTQGEP